MSGTTLDNCTAQISATKLTAGGIAEDSLRLIYQSVLPEYTQHFCSDMTQNKSKKQAFSAMRVAPLGDGLINRTYLVSAQTGQFVLQKINCHVFPAPWTLINNSARICDYLNQQVTAGQYQLSAIKPLATDSGVLALDLGGKGFWRLLSYVPNSLTRCEVNDAQMALQVGSTFGHFAATLAELEPSSIVEVIEDFLNLPKRLQQLKQAAQQDKHGRLSGCQSWVDMALNQHDLINELVSLEASLPRRICHNDTKINNMLFSATTGEPLAVIDLDTCMPGYLMYDFGDMVRAFCSPVAEDSLELERIEARPELILAAAKGYTHALRDTITEAEQLSLWLGVKVMTLMLASRFLSDYLQGDEYFAVTRPQHNLQRAVNQFTLYQSQLAQDDAMRAAFSRARPVKSVKSISSLS
jgi:Ser/Thr protein kinase RdoA (MazF antagonist)